MRPFPELANRQCATFRGTHRDFPLNRDAVRTNRSILVYNKINELLGSFFSLSMGGRYGLKMRPGPPGFVEAGMPPSAVWRDGKTDQ